MTDDGGAPVHDGPDPRNWPKSAPGIWGLILDIEYLDRVLAAMDGAVPAGEALAHETARDFLEHARQDQRAALAAAVLGAYHVELPEGTAEPTEAVGGTLGDGDRPGDRDNV